MKNILIALLMLLSLTASAQSQKPDYDKIEKAIADKNSTYFYPQLLDRFEKGDTTLTLEQKRHLYYGFQFQSTYKPYEVPKEMGELRPLLQKKPMSDDSAKKISALAKKILQDNPFDVKMMNILLYASERTKETALFNATLNQMKITIDAMASSGDGKSKETAYYVISISDEYQLLAVLGLQFGGKQSLVEKYDYLEVAENPAKIKGLYFDISAGLGKMVKSLEKP